MAYPFEEGEKGAEIFTEEEERTAAKLQREVNG